jgi:hypothetical protein
MDARTTSAADFILTIAMLITNRDEVAASIKESVDKIKEARAVGAELERREHEVLQRERACEAAEKALAKRSADVTERENQAEFQMHRLIEERDAFTALKRNLKQSLAA